MSKDDQHHNHAAESHQRSSQKAAKGTHGYDLNAVFGRDPEGAAHIMHGMGNILLAGQESPDQQHQNQLANKHTMAELVGGNANGSSSSSTASSGGSWSSDSSGSGSQKLGGHAEAIVNNFGNRQTMADLVGGRDDKKKDGGWSLGG